nr:hypothetical protein [Tanacetum cinerariifolium]
MADHPKNSSVYVVVSNDDLLTEILLRLPASSLHLFKSVSKCWLSLIIDTRFTLRWSLICSVDPSSGLFIWKYGSRCEYTFVSFDIRIPSKRSFAFTLGVEAPSNVWISHSCNGLLLCFTRAPSFRLYVYNPSNNQCKMLPQSPIELVDSCMKMVFDPTKSPYYKVIHAAYKFPATRIQIYFSKTGVWSVCGDLFPNICDFRDGIFHNDAIHWLSNWTKPPLHYKLDIINENPLITNIQLPVDEKVVWDRKLFESCGCLLLLGKDYAHTRKFTIYEMRNGYLEWSLKYIVNIDDIPTCVSNIVVWCIVLGEREEDSFMVITLPGKIVQYRILLKTLNTLCEYRTYGVSRDIQFIASYAAI